MKSQKARSTSCKVALGRDSGKCFKGIRQSQSLSRPWSERKDIMKGIARMLYEGLMYVGFALLMLVIVVLLPAAALLTRALIPAAAISMAVLFVASCFSRRMRDWLYS